MKIRKRLQELKSVYFILFFTALTYISSFILNLLVEFFNIPDIYFATAPKESNHNTVLLFLEVIIFAPLFETLLHQVLVYKIFDKFSNLEIKKNEYLLIFFSALFFGLIHFYSVIYIFNTFFIGGILMYAYILKAKNKNKAFILLIIIHLLRNLYPFIHKVFFD